jgi:hypothetical protein
MHRERKRACVRQCSAPLRVAGRIKTVTHHHHHFAVSLFLLTTHVLATDLVHCVLWPVDQLAVYPGECLCSRGCARTAVVEDEEK